MQKTTGNRWTERWFTTGLPVVLLVCIALYAAWNEPLKRAILNLRPLGISLIFVISFTGWGTIFRRFMTGHNQTIQILSSTALGTALTALFVFILGLAGLLPPSAYLLWLISGIILFLRAATGWHFRMQLDRPRTSWDVLASGIIVLFLGSAIPFFVAPETTTDALEYHLLIPKIYLMTGRIGFIPLLLESNYPSLAEYIFLFVLRHGSIVCKCLHFWFGILVLLQIRALAKKVSPSSSGLLSAALFVSMPVALVVFGWSWNDMMFTFFVLLSLYYLLCFQTAENEPGNPQDLFMSGLLAGVAAWTKYTFAIYLLVLLLFSLQGFRRGKWTLRHILLLFAPIAFFCSLWGIKNWAFTGNPVFPFLNSVFHSPHITPQASEYFRGTLTRYEFPDWTWYTPALYPFLATLKPNIIDVHTGVLPLLLILLSFRKSSPSGRFLKLYAALYMIVWLLVQTEVRSFFSVLAVLSVLGGVALEELRWSSGMRRLTMQTLVLAAAGCSFVISMVSTYYVFDPVRYFLGLETQAQYLTRLSRSQPVYDYLNTNPDVRKVALIGIHNPFYLQKPFLFSSCCDIPLAEALTRRAGNEDLADFLRSAGVTHVVVNYREYEREHKDGLFSWAPAERAKFEGFLRNSCRPVIQFGYDRVHELKKPE